MNAFVQTMRDERKRDVQFKMPIPTGCLNGLAKPLHIEANLHQHLTHHGIHLARHDGRAGLGGDQLEFRQSGART